MTKVLSNLKPQPLWNIFESICEIPHPSGHIEKIAAFIMDFADKNGLEAYQDKIGNIIIRKPATLGYEDRKGVILQSHIDMVPQKNSDSDHDFENDPIKPRIVGKLVKATNTTLGADNGIGVATSLALMISNEIEHGPLECLMTIDEETGMTGAMNLEPGKIKGDILINLDSEVHGELFVGCAGGMRTSAYMDYDEEDKLDNHKIFQIAVKGLKGGHSGVDIHLQRANAIKIMARLLSSLNEKIDLRISSINGGTLQNAIPREAFSIIAINSENENTLKENVNAFQEIIRNEFSSVDPDISISIEPVNKKVKFMKEKVMSVLLHALLGCPCGVYRMSDDMEGLVETSNNLATINAGNGNIKIQTSQRSSVDSRREEISSSVKSIFELAGFKVLLDSSYPGWKPDLESPILGIVKKSFIDLFGQEPKITAIHAGLECGLFKSIYPDWDMISIGPDIYFPHSPDESVNIATVEYFWRLLQEILKRIPKK